LARIQPKRGWQLHRIQHAEAPTRTRTDIDETASRAQGRGQALRDLCHCLLGALHRFQGPFIFALKGLDYLAS
jgi:hypothetical protein